MYMLESKVLFTYYAGNEKFEGKSDLPGFRLERVLDLEWWLPGVLLDSKERKKQV